MAEGDKGWAGAWEPNIVGADVLAELQDRAGEPIMGPTGRPLEWVRGNLRTGEFVYHAGTNAKARSRR